MVASPSAMEPGVGDVLLLWEQRQMWEDPGRGAALQYLQLPFSSLWSPVNLIYWCPY